MRWSPISQLVLAETPAAQVLIGSTSSTSIVVFSISKVWIAPLAAVVVPLRYSPTMLPLFAVAWIAHLYSTAAANVTFQVFAVTEYVSSTLRLFNVAVQLARIGVSITADYVVLRLVILFLFTWFLWSGN